MIQDNHFYRKDLVGPHYAQARYLLMYLQEKNLLARFYADLHKAQADDPTGLKTLQSILGKDLTNFEPQWREWVMSLHFP